MTSLFEPAGYAFSWYAVPVLGAGLLNWVLGFATAYRERASKPSLTLLALTISIGVWLVGLGAAYLARDEGLARGWIEFSLVGTAFVPVCVFTNAAMGSSRIRLMRVGMLAGCLLSTALSVIILSTDLILVDVHHYFWGYYPIYGTLGPVLILYYAFFFVAGGILYRSGGRATKSLTHRRRMRIRLATLLIATPATIDFLATMHIGVYPCGYAFILAYVGLSVFSIGRYRLVDITPALAARQIIDTMAEGLLVFDRDGAIRVANAAVERLAGVSELLGVSCKDLDQRWREGRMSDLLNPDEQNECEITYGRPDGEQGVVAVVSSRLLDARGEWVGVVCIMHDITERQRSEAAVRASEALYRTLVETSPDGVLLTDATGIILMTNGRAAELIGLAGQEGVGRPALEFVAGEDRERLVQSIRDARGDAVVRDGEYALRRADETTVSVELSMTRVSGDDSEVRMMAVVRDISERKAREEEIRHLAFHDALTGAATRAVLRDRMSEAIARARRAGTHVALIFADLDGFKRINDTRGHDAGDDVLRDVSGVLAGVLRESDTLARVGGDEFVLLLPDLPHADAALSVAERILRELRAAAGAGRLSGVTCSLGVAVFPRDADDADELLRHADSAMYAAKRRGGDQFRVWASDLRSAA